MRNGEPERGFTEASVESTREEADTGDHEETGIRPEEEPVVTGTLFIMVLFLMAMGALWGLMYLTLLER